MKKLILSLLVVAFAGTSASAQYYHLAAASGNPNNINQEDSEYPVGSGLPTDWTSILGHSKLPVAILLLRTFHLHSYSTAIQLLHTVRRIQVL